jgi:hypothetical protein
LQFFWSCQDGHIGQCPDLVKMLFCCRIQYPNQLGTLIATKAPESAKIFFAMPKTRPIGCFCSHHFSFAKIAYGRGKYLALHARLIFRSVRATWSEDECALRQHERIYNLDLMSFCTWRARKRMLQLSICGLPGGSMAKQAHQPSNHRRISHAVFSYCNVPILQ